MSKVEQEIIILDFQDWCVREGYMYWGEHEGHPQLFTRENMDYIEQ